MAEKKAVIDCLPRTIMNAVLYQIVIRGFENEWTVSYEFGNERFGDITAHGRTVEEAAEDMQAFMLTHAAFKYLRHKLETE
jgi:hypothetical protein